MTDRSEGATIGARLRALRVAAQRSLASVAQEVGISSSALSQIETGAMQPSVNRLIEIVGVIGAPVAAIFEDYRVLHPAAVEDGDSSEMLPGVLVRAPGTVAATKLGQGVIYRPLAPVGLDGVDLFESVYPPLASTSVDGAMLVHEGYEIGSVISGTLRFEFSEGSIDLGPGGALSFWASRPHRVVNPSPDTTAVAIWLTLHHYGSHSSGPVAGDPAADRSDADQPDADRSSTGRGRDPDHAGGHGQLPR